MLVGLTYDLRDDYRALGLPEEDVLEFDSEETIAAIEGTLQALGYATRRIGRLQSLVSRLAQGERWDIVFNVAEGLSGSGREAAVPALLDSYGIPYTFSDPLTLCVTLDKAAAKKIVRHAGLPTPDFAVCAGAADLARVSLSFPLFVKPLSEGTGKGIGAKSLARSPEELRSAAEALIARFRQPVLVESFLPGREFTVGIAGTGPDARVLGVMEVVFGEKADGEIYGSLNKEECDTRVSYRLAEDATAREAAAVALASYRELGCRDAGRVDLRADAQGRVHFMEVNPLAGLHPGHSDLPILCRLAGIPYRDLLDAVMTSATKRCDLPRPG